MQIDFHHAVTYVVARCAGFSHEEADTISTCAQYVDDAVNKGTIFFDNGAMYTRIASAHKMIDLDNADDRSNHLTWLPFHFLPGNNGIDDPVQEGVEYLTRMVCKPNSPVAKRMVELAIAKKGTVAYDLHLLGVTMHVYADTWAHQGFVGMISKELNEVEDAQPVVVEGGFLSHLELRLADFLDDAIPPLGHGRATTLPDLPYLKWEYKDGSKSGDWIIRDNTANFVVAANEMCKAMQRWRGVDVKGISQTDLNAIKALFLEFKDKDPDVRHAKWLNAIRDGNFSFGSQLVTYSSKSWKKEALGQSSNTDKLPYKPGFLKSDWKKFHDATQEHRLTVLHDILPEFGLCAG